MSRKHFLGILLFLLTTWVVQAQETERQYLSGTGLGNTVTWQFRVSEGRNSGRWSKIEVPSQWELQGFGEYTYGRWYKKPGVKNPSMEEGTYKRSFRVPRNWQGQNIRLWFDGVMTDTEVLVNGQSAGPVHQGGFYRFSYDVTELLKYGSSNQIEVRVKKHSDNRTVNAAERKADWWLFGGIYRPVWLEAKPATHIERLAVDAQADGTLKLDVYLKGVTEEGYLGIEVEPLQKKDTLFEETIVVFVQFKEGASTLHSTSRWEDICPWTPESPNLYQLRVYLCDKNTNPRHFVDTRIGFRTIDFRPRDGLYLNGTKLVMKGINRHSFHPDGGRTTNKELSIQDVKLIKEMNMNAVRSHYPPDEHFLDMCDSLGLVYMDELAGWQNGYDSKVGAKLVKEMIERDVNHPCIILWSNGNEGGWNTQTDPLFAQYDRLQKRHMVHPWADFNDLDTHHYPTYLTGVARFTNGYKVFMPTEFMHAMYDQGGGAGLRDFWDRWCTNPLFAGGFIWVYCDEAPKRSDKGGILDSDKSNAPDGVVGPRREKEGSYYAIRAQWSPIQLKPLLITNHFDGSFLLTNEYTFTNLKECRMTYKVLSCGTPLKGDAEAGKVIAEGKVQLPSINPGETGTARFELPDSFREGDMLELEAFDREGKSICNWTYPIHLAKQYFERNLSQTTLTPAPQKAEARQTSDAIELKSSIVSITFDAATGMIRHIKSGETEVPFKDGPVAIGMKMRYEPSLSYTRHSSDGAIYCAKYKGAADSIVWRLTNEGLLYMDAILLNRGSGGGGFDDAFMDAQVFNLGLSFSYPEQNCSGMKWMGRGPYRVWKNRIPGTNYGIWHKDYNNTITGESFENLIYPEFKGYHANLYWATLEGEKTSFTVYSRNDGTFFRVFTPEEPAGRVKDTMPAFPEGDLSFLLDIPAICSFKPIEQQGPNSQPGNIRIKSGDEGLHLNLMFDFR